MLAQSFLKVSCPQSMWDLLTVSDSVEILPDVEIYVCFLCSVSSSCRDFVPKKTLSHTKKENEVIQSPRAPTKLEKEWRKLSGTQTASNLWGANEVNGP